MSYEIIISIAALLDIEEAATWYENQNLNLGSDLRESLLESLSKLELNPFISTKKYKEIRVLYIRRFPYGIHFTIDGDKVKIYGFFHMKRNPTKWLERLK